MDYPRYLFFTDAIILNLTVTDSEGVTLIQKQKGKVTALELINTPPWTITGSMFNSNVNLEFTVDGPGEPGAIIGGCFVTQAGEAPFLTVEVTQYPAT